MASTPDQRLRLKAAKTRLKELIPSKFVYVGGPAGKMTVFVDRERVGFNHKNVVEALEWLVLKLEADHGILDRS